MLVGIVLNLEVGVVGEAQIIGAENKEAVEGDFRIELQKLWESSWENEPHCVFILDERYFCETIWEGGINI